MIDFVSGQLCRLGKEIGNDDFVAPFAYLLPATLKWTRLPANSVAMWIREATGDEAFGLADRSIVLHNEHLYVIHNSWLKEI